MDAELAALDIASIEAEWLRELLMDKPILAILINCDNQMMITKVKNSQDNMKSNKHVKRRLKSVGKQRSSRVIAMDYIQIAKNLADPFTKELSRTVIDNLSKEMGSRPM
jgi:Icc-related predicted phosphoesterase